MTARRGKFINRTARRLNGEKLARAFEHAGLHLRKSGIVQRGMVAPIIGIVEGNADQPCAVAFTGGNKATPRLIGKTGLHADNALAAAEKLV